MESVHGIVGSLFSLKFAWLDYIFAQILASRNMEVFILICGSQLCNLHVVVVVISIIGVY